MEFRGIAAVALWTLLSGPIFNGKGSVAPPSLERSKAGIVKTSSLQARSRANLKCPAHQQKSW
jgi:hypothetical protein